MDIAWNGILTCDYERTRPHASPLERELYTRSLTAWPAVFLDSPRPYGSARRPGIVDVSESDHNQLVRQLHDQLSAPRQARALTERAAAQRQDAAAALDSAERSLAAAGPAAADWPASPGVPAAGPAQISQARISTADRRDRRLAAAILAANSALPHDTTHHQTQDKHQTPCTKGVRGRAVGC